MTDANEKTLLTYDENVRAYVDGTAQAVNGAPQQWMDRALDGLAPDARILEIGSAFGRDAAYIASKKFTIECTDATPGFVSELLARGFSARLFNVLTDPFDGAYDLILANAVLLHFDRAQLPFVLEKARAALKPAGRLAFSLKAGDGEGWSSAKLGAPRYFCYWRAENLPALLRAAGFAGWSIVEAHTNRAHADWIFVVATAP
ncbi:SAM-dependent methyltransferase [Rhodoblastus acidophilus]|uniref:class I SAM-dependent DNA methyltransferase n=1 Tax=Rhodoblastus acidophilus TaxID=1074 RepID=UPI00222405F9|nr:class I SAM-dependent methyltransferase [Rhodoblastus acidophilus]MCW2314858.1 SAM-dependent methyltransferase [Rhodoblastus acidophilus]